jgi:hypothetical protein
MARHERTTNDQHKTDDRQQRSQEPAPQAAESQLQRDPQGGVLQRAGADPQALNPRDVLALQRTIGNRAVQRLLVQRATRTTIQPKLTVGPAGGEYEHEAGQVAEQVSRLSSTALTHHPAVQRRSRGGGAPQDARHDVQRLEPYKDEFAPAPGGVRAYAQPRFRNDSSAAHLHTDDFTIQRSLISEASRAFSTAAPGTLLDSYDATQGPTYAEIRDDMLGNEVVPVDDQSKLIKVRGAVSSKLGKSPEYEKKLKDLVRAFLVAMYWKRLKKLETDPELSKPEKAAEKAKKKAAYLEHADNQRQEYSALLEKGVNAPETKAFMKSQGFTGIIDPASAPQVDAKNKGPRIDVRSTYVTGKFLGRRVRAHLFIVYTGSGGQQVFFRGGPASNAPGAPAVAIYGDYMPGTTTDYDPSAPSRTLLTGEAAAARLDALYEAAGVIDGMGVPYSAGGAFEEGENCNSVAWTVLTRAGIAPGKPSGMHPGWGHILGTLTPGKEKALPQREDLSMPGQWREVTGTPGSKLEVWRDRGYMERGPDLPVGTQVELLEQNAGNLARIRYHGKNVGYVDESNRLQPPVWRGAARKAGGQQGKIGKRAGSFREMVVEAMQIPHEAESAFTMEELKCLYEFAGFHGKGASLTPQQGNDMLNRAGAPQDVLYHSHMKRFLRDWLGMDKEEFDDFRDEIDEVRLAPLRAAFNKLPGVILNDYLPVHVDSPNSTRTGALRPSDKIRISGAKQGTWREVKKTAEDSYWVDDSDWHKVESATPVTGHT